MTGTSIALLIVIGLMAGVLSGFVGIGGGVVIVPALVFFLGFTQHQAQGTSLFVLAMPVVALGVYNYWKTGNVQWQHGLIIAASFLIGGYIGSKLSLKTHPGMVKLIFGTLMAYVSVRLIISGINSIGHES
jgi:uncharacterized membrane protein YfcA